MIQTDRDRQGETRGKKGKRERLEEGKKKQTEKKEGRKDTTGKGKKSFISLSSSRREGRPYALLTRTLHPPSPLPPPSKQTQDSHSADSLSGISRISNDEDLYAHEAGGAVLSIA